jgi:hypothetical protein
MSNFTSKLSGCGRFTTKEDRELVEAVRARRELLRIDPRPPIRVRLSSKAETRHSEASIYQTVATLRRADHYLAMARKEARS